MRSGKRGWIPAAVLATGLYVCVSSFTSIATAQSIITTVAGGGTNSTVATSAVVLGPRSVAVGGMGNVFIASLGMYQVFKVTPTGTLAVVAGSGAANFFPVGVVIDRYGNLFVADNSNNRILRVDAATGNITVVGGNGTPGFSGDGGLATSAELNNPSGVAVDSSGNFFIADTGNTRIRKVDASTGIITTVAGNGTAGYSGDGGAATSASLYSPLGVALDGTGNLFIADTLSNRIRRVDAAAGTITTVAGYGTPGFSGDGGPGVIAALNGPAGVAVDGSGNVFIADTGNQRVRCVDGATDTITTVAGNGTPAYSGDGGSATSASLNYPQGMAVDGSGNLFIADTWNNRVRKVAPSTGIITTVAGGGSDGDGGPATSATLNHPFDMVVDASGNFFIADTANPRIRRVDAATGIITAVAGDGAQGFSGDGGPATSAGLNYPEGVAVDGSGDLFIADTVNNRIRRVNAATGIITTVAGNGTAGSSGDGGPATSAQVNNPYGVTVDSSGNLFIADTFNNALRRVDGATGVITTESTNLKPPAESTNLKSPTGLAVDSSGNVFIADHYDSCIVRPDALTETAAPVAGKCGPDAGFYGDGSLATQAELNLPNGVAVDGSGNLFIADTNNMRIRRVDAATGIIWTVAGNGTAGYDGDGGPATSAELNYPTGVAVDRSGHLFIADINNSRIREVALAPVVALSGAGLSFSSQVVDTPSAVQPVTVMNAGGANLVIASVVASSDFSQTNNCPISPATLNPGSTCTINVVFAPTTAGPLTGAITITDNAFDSPQTISLGGTGLPPVSLSPVSLTFPSQAVGTTSAPEGVTLTNNATTVLNITSIVASGDFAQSNNCGSGVAAGADCAIAVTFTPTATGIRTGTLSVTDSAPTSPQTVSLSGTSGPVASLSATSLSFASQAMGTTSAAQSVTLTDSGTAALTITSVAASGDFAQTNNCPSSLAVGISCTVSVTFKPTATGTRTGAISITDTAGGSPHTVQLTGTGADFGLSYFSGGTTITAGQTASYTLKISPEGGFNQAVALACSGAPQAATCSLSSSSVTLNGSSATSVTVTVATTARSGMMPRPDTGPPVGTHPSADGPLLVLVVLLALVAVAAGLPRHGVAAVSRLYSAAGLSRQLRKPPFENRKAKTETRAQGTVAPRFSNFYFRFSNFQFRASILATTLLLIALAWAACGGGGGTGIGGGHPGTPAGSYTLTVTATYTSGSTTLQHTLPLPLTVN